MTEKWRRNGSAGIRLYGSATVTGNLIGVAPDGVTQMPNGTGILPSGAGGTTIGSIADPNTIAFNSAGVDGTERRRDGDSRRYFLRELDGRDQSRAAGRRIDLFAQPERRRWNARAPQVALC